MLIVDFDKIKSLKISPVACVEWIKESFSIKKGSQLPPKCSIHPEGLDFYTSMPCLLPKEYDRFCLKLVHRISGATPALGSDILVYEASSGELLALMDCDWITAMRTGAVATLAAQTLRKSGEITYSFIGLGNTARATLSCLLDSERETMHNVILEEYKGYSEDFIRRFSGYGNVRFSVMDSAGKVIRRSDVVYSCVTQADGLICEDLSCFRPGCLVIPVHTRGFQNCDTVFDKVFADDTAHVRGFKYFDKFRRFAELQDVLSKEKEGRSDDTERILSYNVGIALHDALFASKILDIVKREGDVVSFGTNKPTDKFWV